MPYGKAARCSDGGAVLLKAAEHRYGLLSELATCLRDQRQAGKVDHSLRELLAQRVFSIACGYPDANDSARLSGVSAVAYAFETLEEVLKEAKTSAEVTHNHPEGVKGAQAAAAATFMARQGESKGKIRSAIEKLFRYDLSQSIASIRPTYVFNESCQGTVPEAITAFLESEDYEDAIRLAISLGGDADTLACIAGGIAGAFYGGVPDRIAKPALVLVDDGLMKITRRFCEKYRIPLPPHDLGSPMQNSQPG